MVGDIWIISHCLMWQKVKLMCLPYSSSLFSSMTVWDKRMSNTKFNWCWHNTPTYAPYTVESVHMPLILISVGSAKSAKGALLVLQSLTPNAQSVFRTLANYQLNHPEEQGEPGMHDQRLSLSILVFFFSSWELDCHLWEMTISQPNHPKEQGEVLMKHMHLSLVTINFS